MAIDNRTCFQVNLRDALRCRACGRGPTDRETYHRGFGYHHVLPRSRGGPDVVQNLVLLCQRCHDAHHRGHPLDFDAQRAPSAFACRVCDQSLDPDHVEMNCGWYRCPRCRERVHLFDHFEYGAA